MRTVLKKQQIQQDENCSSVTFDIAGGFIAKYKDTGKIYDSNSCFIDGVRCHADEARFGGIVVQKR